MSKTLLIHTLGNRDLQFRKKGISHDLIEAYSLETNSENPNFYLCVPKTIRKEGGKSVGVFRKITEKIQQDLEEEHETAPLIKQSYDFPMLKSACYFVQKEVEQIDEVRLIGTAQDSQHDFDTLYVTDMAKNYTQKYCATQLQNGQPSILSVKTDFLHWNMHEESTEEEIYTYFYAILGKYLNEGYDKIYMSCNTGIPDVTAALKALGYWRDEFVYLKHLVDRTTGETNTKKMFRLPKSMQDWGKNTTSDK